MVAPIPNQLPTVTSTPRTLARPEQLYSYDILASDPDGDALTYELVNAPAGAVLDGERLVWNPTAAQMGDNAFSIRIRDSQGGSITHDFEVQVSNRVVNHTPVITSAPELTTHLDRDYRSVE
ncbi:putative Ig domain-containing protein [Synechococcus sp. PCC 7336]|uniref:Ig-like domain-containing protein n=1 Tax=Synechococcus sp. PCC 7336 TaxID=195250 RepID=UPI0003499907|nr:putative Ig domain-containing protein [Synechococcus sp. PCC 7336]